MSSLERGSSEPRFAFRGCARASSVRACPALGRVADTELDLTVPKELPPTAKLVVYVPAGYLRSSRVRESSDRKGARQEEEVAFLDMAVVRLGTCSWADEGLVKTWYPKGVSSAAARLGYYSERYDAVEVDSPFYRLPSPETAARWAERTPEGFIFHAKASKAMTGHEEADVETAFREFRKALEPLEAAGKLRGVLMQYPPRFKKSPAALAELEPLAARLDPLVPLVEFRHRSWMTDEEQVDTLAFLERHGLSYVSVDSPATRATNVMPRIAAATHPVAYVRFHGRNWKTWNAKTRTSGERFDWLYSKDDLQEWVEPLGRLAQEAEEVYAFFNNNRHDYAPRSAIQLRELLDEAGIPVTGGVEPAPVEPTLF